VTTFVSLIPDSALSLHRLASFIILVALLLLAHMKNPTDIPYISLYFRFICNLMDTIFVDQDVNRLGFSCDMSFERHYDCMILIIPSFHSTSLVESLGTVQAMMCIYFDLSFTVMTYITHFSPTTCFQGKYVQVQRNCKEKQKKRNSGF
jgi:hypothetical protein